MRSDTATAEIQRVLLVLAVAGSALMVGPRGGLDGIAAGKSTAVMLSALLAVSVAAWAVVADRQISVPVHPAVIAGAGFGLLYLVRALLSDRVGVALYGPMGRWNGALFYLACVSLFAVAVTRSNPKAWRSLACAWLVVAAIVALSAVDEATLRLGPDWADRPGVAGTLGNANFLGAWTAVLLPIAIVVGADTRLHRAWRVMGIVTAALLVVAGTLSQSLQTAYITAAGLVVLGLVWTSERLSRRLWWMLCGATATAGVIVGTLTVLGATGRGPLAVLNEQVGVRLRGEYWAAATRMFSDHPLGIDPSAFADHYRSYRTPHIAVEVDLASNTDSAHNVPLHLFAEAGVLVGLVFVAVVLLVAWSLIRGLQAREGIDRLWLGGLGAAWAGYVLQSLISIDSAALAVLGWVLAGLIVGASNPSIRAWGPGRARGRRRSTTAPQYVGGGLLIAVSLVGLWAVTTPYRADAASAGGEITMGPRTATNDAVRIAPWQVAYRTQLAQALAGRDQLDRAETVISEAAAINPRSFEAALNAARIAATREEVAEASERYARARELEPHHPDLAVEMAQFAAKHGNDDLARELLDQVAAIDPDHEGLELRDEL